MTRLLDEAQHPPGGLIGVRNAARVTAEVVGSPPFWFRDSMTTSLRPPGGSLSSTAKSVDALHVSSLPVAVVEIGVVVALLGLVALLARRRRHLLGRLLLAGTAASVATRLVLVLTGATDQRIMFGPDSRADALLIGCLLAVHLPALQGRLTGRLATVGGLVVVACVPLGPEGAWTLLPVALGTAAVVAWAVTTPGTGAAYGLLSWRPLRALGRISYGVYLWHLPFALAFATGRQPWVAACLALATSVGLATVSWLLVERPALQRGRGGRPARDISPAGPSPDSGMPPARGEWTAYRGVRGGGEPQVERVAQ
jgi:peptidoglycan/LPS O-acetylase OafA/YrhL